jgi:hypothetical protein
MAIAFKESVVFTLYSIYFWLAFFFCSTSEKSDGIPSSMFSNFSLKELVNIESGLSIFSSVGSGEGRVTQFLEMNVAQQ